MSIYENEKYTVDLLEEPVDEKNYSVVNKEHDTIEATTQNLPQALTLADQFNVILTSELHKIWAEGAAVEGTLMTPTFPTNDDSIN